MTLRTPQTLETHATLAPAGAAVRSQGKEKPSIWSSVNGRCSAVAEMAATAASRRSAYAYYGGFAREDNG
jgi:hypothetical protein